MNVMPGPSDVFETEGTPRCLLLHSGFLILTSTPPEWQAPRRLVESRDL